MAKRVLILNGPNLNMLGNRETATYGTATLGDIEAQCREEARGLGLDCDFRQSNHEGELIDWIQTGRQTADAIVINAGAYTHTSVAIHDALRAAEKPVVEVHLSNIFAREPFRHHSYVSPVAWGVICGLGPIGYRLALVALAQKLAS
jgi:3-dehydroquinate dehydratase-2